MTFTQIVARVMQDLNLRGPDTQERIGNHVNERYNKVLRALGMNIYTRVETDVELQANSQLQIYDLDDPVISRIVAIFWTPAPTDDNPNPRPNMLDEITFDEMKTVVPTSSDEPKKWCKVRVGNNWTEFKIDSTIPNGATVTIEGEEVATALEGNMEPQFEEYYHDMLIVGAKADELMKMKDANSQAAAKRFENEFSGPDGNSGTLGELRLRQSLMAGGVIKQGKHAGFRNPLVRRGPSINGNN